MWLIRSQYWESIHSYFDRRVLEDALAAEAVNDLERTLRGPILDELRGLARCRALSREKAITVVKKRGRKIPLSLARKMIGDFLAVSQRVPLAHGERRIDIRALRDAVMAMPRRSRLDWLPIFFKAYAIVAANRPALRRLFVRRPWPYLYEHPENVGSVVISRRLEGDDALLYLPIVSPEKLSLRDIERVLEDARERPIAEIPAFRRQVRMARLPGFCRRPLLRLGIDWTTRHRVRRLGTFGMSVLASMGIANLTTWVPWTTMIHYTPFDDAGSMWLRIALDHRVLDGLEVAYALREMEEVLNRQILDEVLQMDPAHNA